MWARCWPVLHLAVTCSLSHDVRFVVGACSRDPPVRSNGIDVEPIEISSSDIARWW
jgi:4'-phosphopantetheinyl transferase EntD